MNLLRPYRVFTQMLLIALAVLPAAAQEFAFRTFTVSDGLISNFVTMVRQDSKGYLWIGTDEGFSIYDGHQFTNIRFPPGRVWGYVNDFLESPRSPGVMWIATNGNGVIRYSAGEFTTFTIDSSDISNRVNDLYEDSSGTLWCTTDNGLYLLKNGAATRLPIPDIPAPAVIQVCPVGADHIWVSSPYALLSIHRRTFAVRMLRREMMEGTNQQIIPLQQPGLTAVVFRHSVLLFRNDSVIQRLPLPRSSYGNADLDRNGTVWIGGGGESVQRISTAGGRLTVIGTYNRKSGLPVDDVSYVEADQENNLWFGTPGKGLVRLNDHDNFLLPFPGMTSRGTTDGRYGWWVPTLNGLYHLSGDPPSQLVINRIPFERSMLPVAVTMVGSDTLWCTTYGGGVSAYRIHRGPRGRTTLSRFFHMSQKDGIPILYSVVIFKDSQDKIWCSLDGYAVMVIDTRRLNASPLILRGFGGIPPTTLAAFTETPDGKVYVGGIGSNALLEFDRSGSSVRFVRAHRPDSLISSAGIRGLAAMPDGSLWIATRYDGLIRRHADGRWQRFTEKDGLHSMQVLSLFADGNALWIGTQSGMEYMPDIAVSHFIRSSELTRSPVYTIGRFKGAAVWGMSRYEMVVNDPNSLLVPIRTPPLYLTSFLVNGIPQNEGTAPELLRTELISCSFSFACVTFRGNADVQYQYRLDGLHKDWQPLTHERSVTFAQLDAGRYTFHVRGVLDNGKQITEPVTRSFIVVPPLWDRWWFMPSVLVLVLSVVIGAYTFRIRQRLALERVRLSIAADLHDDIGSVLARIANLADILVMSGTAARKKTAASRTVKRGLPRQSAQTIADLSRELLEKMSDVVWSVDPRNDDPRRLLQRVQTYCTEFAEQHRLALRFEVAGDLQRSHFDPQRSRALLLVVKEALTNILKHAGARSLVLTVSVMRDVITLSIADDGRGFDERNLGRVNGIYNMKKRAEGFGGSVTVTSQPGAGTTVVLTIPL